MAYLLQALKGGVQALLALLPHILHEVLILLVGIQLDLRASTWPFIA